MLQSASRVLYCAGDLGCKDVILRRSDTRLGGETGRPIWNTLKPKMTLSSCVFCFFISIWWQGIEGGMEKASLMTQEAAEISFQICSWGGEHNNQTKPESVGVLGWEKKWKQEAGKSFHYTQLKYIVQWFVQLTACLFRTLLPSSLAKSLLFTT